MARNQVDWQPLRLEYISYRGSTYRSLSAKYGVPERTVRWHATKEKWRDERQLQRLKVADNLAASTANAVVLTVGQLNDRWLERSERMQALLEHKLYVCQPDTGNPVPRDTLTVQQIAHAISAFGDLFKLDRLALGVDLEHGGLSKRDDRLRNMSDEELMLELQKLRAQITDKDIEAELIRLREAKLATLQ